VSDSGSEGEGEVPCWSSGRELLLDKVKPEDVVGVVEDDDAVGSNTRMRGGAYPAHLMLDR
jgi:hypothetical protein